MYKQFLNENFGNISNNFLKLQNLSSVILSVSEECIKVLRNSNKIIFCGNGGSAADSQHLAAEIVGRYKLNRPAYNSIALTTDTSILTAVGNDFGYDAVFERQIEGVGKKGDILFGISTSGNSKNIVLAFEKAKSMGIKTVAMTGEKQSKMSKIADYTINVPSSITNNIQEMHIAVGHSICEIVEKEMAKVNKALFLDRDGTINEDKNYLYKPEDFKFIESTVNLCKLAQEKGYLLIVITNQSGVARGYYSEDDMNKCNEYMTNELAKRGIKITEVFCCPYLDSIHPDRKPNPGLFIKAKEKYNIDMENSISFGDKDRDIEAAQKAGVKSNYLVSDFHSLRNFLMNERNIDED